MLSELGLTGYEEKVYVALLQAGPSNPKRISEKSKVPPTAVYPAVQSLVKKGIVLRLDSQIQQYEAVQPKQAIQKLVKIKSQRIKDVQETSLTHLESLEQHQEIPSAPIVLSRGSASSMLLSDELSQRTKKSFYVLGWNFRRSRKSIHDLIRFFSYLQQKKIDIRVLFTRHTETGDKLRREFDKIGILYKFASVGSISLVVSDGQVCKITLKNAALKEQVNLLIDSQDLAAAMRQYFLKLWVSGKERIA